MNTLVTAKLIAITCTLYVGVMLAAMAMLLNCMLHFYGFVLVRVITIAVLCIITYARKRVINRVIHDRKYAIFPINPNGLVIAIPERMPCTSAM